MESESEWREALAKSESLADLEPDARRGEAVRPGRVAIVEPSMGATITLHAEAWGDSDGDGIEDLLVSVLNTVDRGSYIQMRLMRMTRLTADGRLIVLDDL